MPGSLINLKEISEHLGVSKTPLRDTIIQMEKLNVKMRQCIREKSFEEFDSQYYALTNK